MIPIKTTHPDLVLHEPTTFRKFQGDIWVDSITQISIRFFLYSICLTLLTYLILYDATIMRENNLFSENSLTETTQEVFLLLILSLFYITGYLDKSLSPVTTIVSCAFGCGLIREFDSFFDNNLFDGAWQVSVTVLLVTSGFIAYRERRRIIPATYAFIARPSFGVLASGILTVMVFSRFFGQQVLWKEIMGDGFIRSVKNAAEEGVELFGYYLCLIAALEFARTAYRQGKSKKKRLIRINPEHVHGHASVQ